MTVKAAKQKHRVKTTYHYYKNGKIAIHVPRKHDFKRKKGGEKSTTAEARHPKSPKIMSCGFQMKSSRMCCFMFTVSREPVVWRLHFDLHATKACSSVTALSLSTQKTSVAQMFRKLMVPN